MPDLIDLTNETEDASGSEAESDSESGLLSATDPRIRAAARAQLLAIDATPEARLRTIVKELVSSNPAFEAAVMAKFVAARKTGAAAAEVITVWEVCRNCKQEYDASEERDAGECVYHPG